jgi:hypothetical protein
MSARAGNNIRNSQRHARYHCDICHRPFDRKDVLSRHMRVHDARRPPPGARRRACQPCAQSKTRCDVARPTCSSCARRKIVCSFGTADTPSQGQTQESDIIGLPPIGAEHDRYALARSPTDASSVEGVSSFMIPPAGGIQSTAPITNQIGHDLHSPKTGLAATTNQILNHSNEFNPDLFFMPFDNIGFNTNFDWIFESSGIEECESDMFLNTANDQEDSPSQLLPISAPKTLTQSTTMPVVIDDSVEGGPLGGLLIPQP